MQHLIPVTDFNAPELDVYARLSEKQLRGYSAPAPGLFVAESPKVICRALDAGYQPVSLLLDENLTGTSEALELAERCASLSLENPFPLYTAPLSVMERITGYKLTKGILCALRRCPIPELAELIKGAKRLVVLENVMNPTNLGAIFRSAAALSMDAVLLSPGCCDPLYRRAARVSMGTVFQVPWTFVADNPPSTSGEEIAAPWPGQTMRALKEAGFYTVAMALREDTVSLDDPSLPAHEKLAILLGAEGDGLSPETISLCDCTVKIPMAEGVDSLNVAAAGAVVFWQLRKGS